MDQQEVARRTAAARQEAMAYARQAREEREMTLKIKQAWQQLDVATDEIVRLNEQIERAGQDGDLGLAQSFERDRLVEQSKALGKAEILALLMPEPLNTPEAVGREAGRRFQMRQQGVEPETPGMYAAGQRVRHELAGVVS